MNTKDNIKIETTPSNNKKRWNTKGLISGILIGVTVTVIGIFISNQISSAEETDKLKIATPKIDIEFQELAKNKLSIYVTSTNIKGSKIEKLFFKFDIPGVYSYFEVVNKDKIETFNIKSDLLSGNGGITTSESVTFEVGPFYSGGSLALYIYYEPTKIIKDTLKYFTSISFPLMDLHDYLPYYFYWTYNGTSKTETGSIDLDYLDYIKTDNLMLISRETHLKRSVNDQLTLSPEHPISVYVKGLKYNKTQRVIVPIENNGFSIDTLFIYNDTLDTKTVHKGFYKNYDDVKKMERQRQKWY